MLVGVGGEVALEIVELLQEGFILAVIAESVGLRRVLAHHGSWRLGSL